MSVPTEQHPRWRAAARRHPLAVDAGLALLLWAVLTVAVTTTAEVRSPLGNGLGALANLALVVPLVWRRRAPLATLGAVLAVAVVTVPLLGGTGGELALLVALATAVAAASSWAAAAVPAALSAAGLAVLVPLGGGADDDELVAGVALLVAAVAVGAAGRLAGERRVVLAERAAERAAGQVRAEARRTEEAITAERARIARELHDVVAHQVTVMVSLADGAQVALDRAPERARAVMAQVSATGREALGELRGLLGVLAPDDGPGAGSAPQPGVAQVGELVQRVRDAGLAASLHVEGAPDELDPVAQLTLYRVAQEALTNVLRHAVSPTCVDVRLRSSATGIDLEVVDDGAGTPPGPTGRGLLGMRQRAALHGAELTAGPADTGGWRVALRLPRDAAVPVGR